MWSFLLSRSGKASAGSPRIRAVRGARYLDEIDPGWHDRLEIDQLELSSGSACVLGQLHGDFQLGLGRSHLVNLSSAPRASLSPVAYGFLCVQSGSVADRERDYERLNEAWMEEVRKRISTSEVESGAAAAAPGAGVEALEEIDQARDERGFAVEAVEDGLSLTP